MERYVNLQSPFSLRKNPQKKEVSIRNWLEGSAAEQPKDAETQENVRRGQTNTLQRAVVWLTAA